MLSSKSRILVTLTVIVLVLAGLSTADDAKNKEECTQPLSGLATCLSYIGGTAKSPTPDCCAGLKQLLNTNKKCLCFAVQERNDPELGGLKVNVTLALALPQVCKAPPINISECPALLGLPPNSPAAQDFYQLAKNSSSTSNVSPAAGGPTAPRTLPLGGAGTPRSQNDGGRINGMAFPFLPVLLCAVCAVYGIFS